MTMMIILTIMTILTILIIMMSIDADEVFLPPRCHLSRVNGRRNV